MLRDHDWALKYTPDDGDLVSLFYVPALEEAERYDRLTGYFNAHALTLAARGIEGLVRNAGRMRLVVGCTLDAPEIDAIERGEALRKQVELRLAEAPLSPPDAQAGEALELLAWMIAKGHLEVKVAVPCDRQGKPIQNNAIFHEKSGVIEDRTGEKIAWTGSLNETAAGWRTNWESINVSVSWRDGERVDAEERNFARIWAGKYKRVVVLDVPDAVRRDMLRFLPEDDALPTRLQGQEQQLDRAEEAEQPSPEAKEESNRRADAWAFIRAAPTLPNGGDQVGEATSAVTPWPHQVRAFERLYHHWPPRLLIADEVGLGKTIQAGMLLRQAWLAGKAKRILVLAPKAVLRQWQVELREKFNLNWPIYDQGQLSWHPSPAMQGQHQRDISASEWHQEKAVIASSHLMRRRDRARALLEAEPWDLVVLDEAHHARRHSPGSARNEDRPNALLDLMRNLNQRTAGLVLLTATPMQVHPAEVWDLLNLLGLPTEWTTSAFLDFFEDVEHPNPSGMAMDRMATLFQAVEREYGAVSAAEAKRTIKLSRLKASKILRALRDPASIPRRQLETAERQKALALMRLHTPIRHLVSRHTRELLRRYFRAGKLPTSIAERDVKDRFINLSAAEDALYGAVEDYISRTYNQAEKNVRNAVGFVMTVYRRRLASSFHALANTLRKRLDSIGDSNQASLLANDEDAPDDELSAGALESEDLANLEREALRVEEQSDISSLLANVEALPPDSKLDALIETLEELRGDGYAQTMVFTQYADTMDFLREQLAQHGGWRLMCYSGRGGEVPAVSEAAGWRTIPRDETKRLFREGAADVLLCTDAAAEGLNFQFCGALVNYDMPWNPMRVEQRIGRIDRVGQQHQRIRIVNLHYDGTVETDVYRALRGRIRLFESVVGKLQPILARLPSAIGEAVLEGGGEQLASEVSAQLSEAEASGFDMDAALDDEVTMPERTPSPLTMDYLDEVISSPDLMPPGVRIRHLGNREYALQAPGMATEVRVTTDAEYYEQHAESVEFWSQAGAAFTEP